MATLQDDLLYETLTVWEVLYYAAMLRLPRTMTTEQKKERVRTVIRALGIERCKDTIIGGVLVQGCSRFSGKQSVSTDFRSRGLRLVLEKAECCKISREHNGRNSIKQQRAATESRKAYACSRS